MYAKKNLASSTVSVAPSPALSGTSLTVKAGEGAWFPSGASFWVVLTPIGGQPSYGVSELVLATRSGDVLTLVRAQGGSAAKSVAVGWIVAHTLTVEMLDEIQAASLPIMRDPSYTDSGYPVMNANGFGGVKLWQSDVHDAFYRASKRRAWTVTVAHFNEDGSPAAAISQYYVDALFIDDYESFITIPQGTYIVITLSFAGEPGGTWRLYPYGWLWLSYYYSYFPGVVTARAYCNYAPHGIGWKTLNVFTNYTNGGNRHIQAIRNDYYAISTFEITVHANPVGATYPTGLTAVALQLDRPSSVNDLAGFSKHRANTLYNDVYVESPGAVCVRDANGQRYAIGVSNAGVLTATPVAG